MCSLFLSLSSVSHSVICWWLISHVSFLLTGNRRTRNRSRGQSRPTNVKENTIKFEGDFDFESANAQFNREELDKEFKKKLNFKGLSPRVEIVLVLHGVSTEWVKQLEL